MKMSVVKELAENFINNSPDFFEDLDLHDVDDKHVRILKESYEDLNDGLAYRENNFRNWRGQSDVTVPMQLSSSALKNYGFFTFILRYAYCKLFRRDHERHCLNSMRDDMDIIKLVGAGDLLIDNPVYLTPGATESFFINGTSVNLRWLRYIYLLHRILDSKLLENGDVWVDVGSYYGGLQGLVRKYQPDSRIVMVDFHHQLCRSYIYLSQLHPNSQHILPNELEQYESLDNCPKGSFIYVPVAYYKLIKDQTVGLVSNFVSLGEMRREFFDVYMNSMLFKESKKSFLINRFVSAPFFEKTYDSDLHVIDYLLDGRELSYFDIFPMHHYQLLKRNLFGRSDFRNVGSSYFEMISSL
jgi:putative sugar O-methyltransferase